MRSTFWAFTALLGLLATLSLVQAAVPSSSNFVLQTPNANARAQADIASDAYGNQYFIRFDTNAAVNLPYITNSAGAAYTGCTYNSVQANIVATHGANVDARLSGIAYLADRNFPATFLNHWLFATTCSPTDAPAGTSGCKLVRYAIKTVVSTPLPLSDCPIDFNVAPVYVADITGTFNSANIIPTSWNNGPSTLNIDYPIVAMTVNPANGVIYVAAAALGATNGVNYPYVFQSPASAVIAAGNANAGAFTGNLQVGAFTVYRVTGPSTGSRVISMAVDTIGTLWVVESTAGTGSAIWVVTPFSGQIRYPNVVSTTVGDQNMWVKSGAGTNKCAAVTADRSGNVYFSTYSASSAGGFQGFIQTFPGIALISGTAQPRNWAYFTAGSFFENSDVAGGPLAYDPYRGRLLVSTPSFFYSITLYTVQFDLTNTPTTLFDTNGNSCPTESATCVRVPILVANAATSFTLKIAAPSWPSAVAGLPFSPNFQVSGSASVSIGPTPFPNPITSTNFGSSTQIGPVTGSFLYSFSTSVTIQSTGFAGSVIVAPAYTGATTDVSFLFTSIPSFPVVVQGAVQATPASSTGYPLSSSSATNGLLAGIPTRFNLALSPSLISGCSAPTVTFTNPPANALPASIVHTYSLPPSAAPADSISINLATAPFVFYTTFITTQYSWQGTFSGTGTCTLSYGVAKVPFYALAVTTQARPSIHLTPVNQLILDSIPVQAGFEVRVVPPVTFGGTDNAAVAFRSIAASNAAGPAGAAASTAPCAGTFSGAASLTQANCNAAATCAATGLSFTPAASGATCSLASGTSAFLVADITAVPSSLSTYFYWNAATQQPTQVGASTSIAVYTVTASLSVRLKWGATRPTPNPQIVAVGDVVGPFNIEYTGAAMPGFTFNAAFGGSFQVFTSTPSTAPTASSPGWGVGPFILGSNYVVYYRAPAPATQAMLASAATDIVINTPAGVSYDNTGALGIQIRFVPSFTTTTVVESAPAPAAGVTQINLWAGNTATTRNNVTVSWGGALLNPNNVITIYGTSNIANSQATFAPTNAAAFTVYSTPVQISAPTRANTVEAGTGACLTPNNCALFSVSGVTTTSLSFIVYGGAPGEIISFWPVVSAVPSSTPAGADSTYFAYKPVSALFYGQVMFNSYPTQVSVLVPTFFGVTVTPPAPVGVNALLSVTDTGSVTLAGTYAFCADISCATPIAITSGAPLNLGTVTTLPNSVIQYIPPIPTSGNSCSGGGPPPYPCALGIAPVFAFEVDPFYAFAYNPNLFVNTNVQPILNLNVVSKFRLSLKDSITPPRPLPVLRGSIAITYMNYDEANIANAPIGVNNNPVNTVYTYPLDNTPVTGVSAVPIPMVGASATGKPSMNFLAGTRYVVGVTMFPPPASGITPSVTVSYAEDTVTATQTFSYNRPDATTLPILSSPPLNASFVNIFPAAVADFVGNRVDGGLKNLNVPYAADPLMCPPNSQSSNRCFVGFFYWTVPAITSDSARNPRIVFTVSGPGSNDYPTQSQSVKISGWCGPSASFRDALQPTHYATPTIVNTVCTPAALPPNTFLNIAQTWRDPNNAAALTQPQFFPAATPFVAGTTQWGAAPDAFIAAGTPGTWMRVFRASTDSSSLAVGMSNIVYSVTTATNIASLSTSYVQIRHISPIVGAYTVKVASTAFAQGGCNIPVQGYIVDQVSSRLPSVSSTSNSYVQVCVFPPRVAAGTGPAYALTVSDGLAVSTNTFEVLPAGVGGAGPGMIADVTTTAFDPAGVSTFASAFLNAGASTKAGLTLSMSGTGTIVYSGFNFNWLLANAATNIAEFRLCQNPTSGSEAAAYTAGVLTTICAANAYPSFPAGTAASPLIQYRPVANTLTSVSATYAVNKVPISVTMQFVLRNVAAGVTFLPNGPAQASLGPPVVDYNFVVGETYAIELRTASTLSSPAEAGLLVTLKDECGVVTFPVTGAPTVATPVAARGQWSSQTLFFSPGETTKTVFYTPREICAPVTPAGGATVNWLTVFSATVCTDATNTQCADGAATRFVNPLPVYVATYGAIRVDNVPAYLPTGVATPSPFTVTLNPPILPAGVTPPVISTLVIPEVKVTVSDRFPSGTTVGAGESAGGSFILGQNTGASATLTFAANGARQSQSISYIAPPNVFFADANNPRRLTNAGISFVASGPGAAYYRVVGAPATVYNGLASIAEASSTQPDIWADPTSNPPAATFKLRIAAEASAAASIEGVFFNVVGGAALAQSTAQSLATVSDNISQFVGNSNVQPGQANNAINFNLPFVSGVPFGYFAAVPFNMSAVVVNVATTANTVFVNNNGWPNAKSAGGSLGGYILPNALSGYVSPVFFLTPGINTFLVAAPLGGSNPDAFVFGSPAGAGGATGINPAANGDGIVYRFIIARDTITNFGLFVSANGYGTLPWSANLPRLQPQYAAGAASLLAVGPGSGSTQQVFTANVENGVQSVSILAQFYGALKARVSSNMNEFGQVLVNIPNNRLVDFPLVVPTNLPGITSSTTSITLLGGGLGPITINVVRPGKSLVFGSQFVSGGTTIASNIVDTPAGPCVARTATSFGLAVYPSSRASQNGLTIKGTYTTAQAAGTPVPVAQAATSATTTWDIVPGVNYVSYATLTATAIPVSALPVTLNLRAVYAADAPSEFTALNGYLLNLCQ